MTCIPESFEDMKKATRSLEASASFISGNSEYFGQPLIDATVPYQRTGSARSFQNMSAGYTRVSGSSFIAWSREFCHIELHSGKIGLS